MSDPQPITTDDVAAIVRAQFPNVRPSTVRYLGEGYDSVAFDVNGEWVFRFPKKEDVEQQLLLEARVLPALERRSPPVPIPSFRLHGRPTSEFPRHFVGYPKLKGTPLFDVDPIDPGFGTCAWGLGHFLSWLHEFPHEEAAALGVEQRSVTTYIDEWQTDALGSFEQLGAIVPDAPLEAWYKYVSEANELSEGSTSAPVLVHADFAAEHVLFDETTRSLTGVIDWSEISISDRSVDLSGLFHWGGEPLVRAALAAYAFPVDELTLRRARYIAVCRGITDIQFAAEMGREEYLRAGLRALSLCIK